MRVNLASLLNYLLIFHSLRLSGGKIGFRFGCLYVRWFIYLLGCLCIFFYFPPFFFQFLDDYLTCMFLLQTKTNAISWNPMEPMNFTAVSATFGSLLSQKSVIHGKCCARVGFGNVASCQQYLLLEIFLQCLGGLSGELLQGYCVIGGYLIDWKEFFIKLLLDLQCFTGHSVGLSSNNSYVR